MDIKVTPVLNLENWICVSGGYLQSQLHLPLMFTNLMPIKNNRHMMLVNY